jgi:hypothetical protein
MKVIAKDERGCPIWKEDDWKPEEVKEVKKVIKEEVKPKPKKIIRKK